MRLSLWSSSVVVVWLLLAMEVSAQPETCTFNTYEWNVIQRKAVNLRSVQHPYRAVVSEQRDAKTGCTVCEEDQVWIELSGVPRFQMCRFVAPHVVPLLEQIQVEGFPFFEVEGYRVGKTRGPVDAQGNRTGYSYHSFGVAIDINPQQNGLYDRCHQFGPMCRLLRGGAWQPGQTGSLHAEHPLVLAFKTIGYKWGGEIAGKQKDFMHFSPTGY